MPIDNKYRRGTDSRRLVDLEVSVSGMEMVVPAGTFVAKKGTSFELTEDENIVIPSPDEDITFSAHLVLDKDNGDEVRVLADFVYQDDSVYDFSKSQRYEKLYRLVEAEIPSGVSSLDDAAIVVWHNVEEVPTDD